MKEINTCRRFTISFSQALSVSESKDMFTERCRRRYRYRVEAQERGKIPNEDSYPSEYRLPYRHLSSGCIWSWCSGSALKFTGPMILIAAMTSAAKYFLSFPCVFQELFCISAAECQMAGAWPVTSAIGALPTTNQWGTVVWGQVLDDQWKNMFIETIVAAMEVDNDALSAMRTAAAKRFDWNLICHKWENLINYDKFDSSS